MSDLAELKHDYDDEYPRATRLMEALRDQILQLLQQNNIALAVPLECRVKQFESIAEKLQRKQLDISRVTDLPDLVGVRLILLFKRDLARIETLLQETLDVASLTK